MQKLKVIFAFLPLLAILFFIYFSTSGFSTETVSTVIHSKPKINTSAPLKTSSTAIVAITLFDLGGNHCLNNDYYICVNGVFYTYETTTSFELEVPCGETVTICVTSSAPCTGSWTGFVSCEPNSRISIYMSPENPRCPCSPL